MSNNRCACPRCLHPTCPLPNALPPFDEVVHEINNNFVSVKIPKTTRQYHPENVPEREQDLSFDFNCADARGEKCKIGCTKVNVIPDVHPPAKMPDEEMLSLKTVRHSAPNGDHRTALEIEFKAPRNYIPLSQPGPPPPIIVPKQRTSKRGKRKKKK